jgi:integrase
VFHCLIGLLSVTGLRLSEALNLELGDVDLEQAVLTIRGAKFGRWRLVPIHPSTCAVLADYLERRARFFGRPVSSYVFATRRGNRLTLATSTERSTHYHGARACALSARAKGHGCMTSDIASPFTF